MWGRVRYMVKEDTEIGEGWLCLSSSEGSLAGLEERGLRDW